MKQPQIMVMTAVLAVAVGMVGIGGSFGDIAGLQNNPGASTDEAQLYKGHIILKHFDADGNLVGYQQTDNLITDDGSNCTANLMFGTGFANCTTPAVFDDIALSTNAGGGFAEGDSTLANECDGSVDVCGAGLDARQAGTVTADTVASTPTDAIAQIQATFTKTDAGSTTINSAGLFDATPTETGNMFAERAFSSGVSLSQNDSLQVTWLITLGR